MPDDSSGNYTLPSGYLAVTGQTIQPSQHNPPLEDIATALTGRLPRSGVAPMTGQLKTITGSASAPAISPNSNPAIGIYWTATGVAFAGTVSGTRYIGELIPYTLLTPEPLTVLPYGQTLLRASYPQLWTKAQADIAAGNTFYNNGDGSTTFGIGDMRGRMVAGKDNMGGTPAYRLTSDSGVSGTILGAVGGAETHTLTAAQLAPHPHAGTTGGMNANNPHYHVYQIASPNGVNASINNSGAPAPITANAPAATVSTDIDHGHPFTTDTGTGVSGLPHNNVPPVMVCNYLLYVGA